MNPAFLDSLLGSLPVIYRLMPGVKFFEPNERFFKNIEAFRGHLIWDIGAGVGHVSKALFERGFEVAALDIIPRENAEYPVSLINALDVGYPISSVLLFCRPCHNGFVEATIRRGITHGVTRFVYTGLAKNAKDDLGVYRHDFHVAERNVGNDNESLYGWEV